MPEPEHFGVAVLEGDRVVRLVEKPTEPLSDLALVGVYLFRHPILDACRTLQPSWRGEYEITEAIQWLLDSGREVRAEMVGGYWKDTGRPEDLLEANRMMLATLTPSIEGDLDGATTVDGDGRRASRGEGLGEHAPRAARDRGGRHRRSLDGRPRRLDRPGVPQSSRARSPTRS